MFDGGEQFHQFIASSRTSLPIPLSFPLHGNPSFSSSAAAFDPYAPPLALHQHNHHQQQLPVPTAGKNPTNLALESERSTAPWSNDELLAMLKVRSSMEIWFPDFTWEHVSRKLGELGFKRSGDQCKEKFEEESRHFNSKNYRILSELDEFYHDHDQEQPQPLISTSLEMDKANVEVDQDNKVEAEIINNSTNAAEVDNQLSHEEIVKKMKSSKKRKSRRRDKFEMLKGFCETVVNKMMSKQEELHNKLIEDIVKMDQENVAREEAWKSQEIERIKTEIEIRSKEQKSAAERQATIIHFLKKFTVSESDDQDNHHVDKLASNNNNINSNTNSNSSSVSCHDVVGITAKTTPSPSSPSSLGKEVSANSDPPLQTTADGGDVGRRWPRDEVLALINLRCKMSGGGGSVGEEGGANSKGPLWERISQGMMELGYKRNAKRCKEKWENINKYFRKTKDSSKKRSVNSRTCPYFHQLSTLYSDGTIVAPTAMPENLQY